MAKWFEILKAGRFKDTSGREHNFSAEDLSDMARKYNETREKHEAPIVIGHPRDNSPAWGWVDKLKSIGNKLLALPEKLIPEFVEANRKGMYRKISISLYPDRTLRHIGFLGGSPPAVKGLEPVLLKDVEASIQLEFAENEMNIQFVEDWWLLSKFKDIARIMGSIRDLFIEKFGTETADKAVNSAVIDWIKEEPPAPPETIPEANLFSDIKSPDGDKEDILMKEKIEKTENISGQGKPAEFSDQTAVIAVKDAKILELQFEIQKRDRQKLQDGVASFVEDLKKSGKVLPKEEKIITDILVNLQEQGLEISFSETEKKPAFDSLKAFLEGLPVRVPLGPVAGQAADVGESSDFAESPGIKVDEERNELYRKAKQLQKADKISFEAAVCQILKRR